MDIEMPSIGHFFYGICLLIPIIYYARDKFSYKVAFIFLINNYIGPDAAQIFIGLPFHSILGFLIYAIPLALFYSYFSRFSLRKSDGLFPLKLEDDKISEVSWKNSYLLCAAGGISHFFIDQFYHFGVNMYVWPGWSISHDEMLSWGGSAYHVVDPLMLISYLIILSALLFSLYAFRKGFKETLEFLLVVIGLFIATVLIFGIETYGGERDVGVLVHSIIYVLIPLFLLMYVARDVQENPITTPDERKISRELLLKIVFIFSLLIAVFFVALALFALIMPEVISGFLASALNEPLEKVIPIIMLAGFLILILSSILLIGTIGLLFKVNICRYMVMSIYTILIILAFPFVIVLFLCEDEVKEMFGKSTKREA